jgi:hypothetical protein
MTAHFATVEAGDGDEPMEEAVERPHVIKSFQMAPRHRGLLNTHERHHDLRPSLMLAEEGQSRYPKHSL